MSLAKVKEVMYETNFFRERHPKAKFIKMGRKTFELLMLDGVPIYPVNEMSPLIDFDEDIPVVEHIVNTSTDSVTYKIGNLQAEFPSRLAIFDPKEVLDVEQIKFFINSFHDIVKKRDVNKF